MGNLDEPDFHIIQTILRKHPDDPAVMNFRVECVKSDWNDEAVETEPLGELTGFLAYPGYLPEDADDWYFDVFDMRSAHAYQAFNILVEHRKLIRKALPNSDVLEFGCGVALLERVWVHPEHRSHKLALRLMREAKHAVGRLGLLVMLKAHPDGDDVKSADNLALAAYYQRDKNLGLRALSKKTLPGWLVAHWNDPLATEGDTLLW